MNLKLHNSICIQQQTNRSKHFQSAFHQAESGKIDGFLRQRNNQSQIFLYINRIIVPIGSINGIINARNASRYKRCEIAIQVRPNQ